MKPTHKIQIGTFGTFSLQTVKNENSSWLSDIWLTLEDLYQEKDWWIGCYGPYDVIIWGKNNDLLTFGEYDKLFNLLQN